MAMVDRTSGIRRVIGTVIAALLLEGCPSLQRHPYVWVEYPVPTDRRDEIVVEPRGSLSIENTQMDTTPLELGFVGIHYYDGSLAQLSEAVATQLASELAKQNARIVEEGAKRIDVSVDAAHLDHGVWVIRAYLRLTVNAGNGYRRTLTIDNASPGTVPRAYNGAVVRAVIALLSDPSIRAYLEE